MHFFCVWFICQEFWQKIAFKKIIKFYYFSISILKKTTAKANKLFCKRRFIYIAIIVHFFCTYFSSATNHWDTHRFGKEMRFGRMSTAILFLFQGWNHYSGWTWSRKCKSLFFLFVKYNLYRGLIHTFQTMFGVCKLLHFIDSSSGV